MKGQERDIAKVTLGLLEQAKVPCTDIELNNARAVREWLSGVATGRITALYEEPAEEPKP